MNYRTLLLRSAVVVGSAIASQAAAQTASAPPAAPAASTGSVMEEVVVTARRREESVQDVPTAISAFSQQALTAKSIASAFDLNKAVPGLTVNADSGNPSQPTFSIRGRGQNYGAAAGSVETYFAEVPLSPPFQIPTLPPQFFDLQSFQVLKGPQGTLFGRSTTGGAVLIVPQAPMDEYGGYLRLQGGTYNDFQAEGAINVPLAGDKADLRVAGFQWQRDGYMHSYPGINAATGAPLPAQTFDNENVKEFRVSLRLRPTDALQNTTVFTYHWDKNQSSAAAGLNLIGVGAPNGLGAFYSPGYGTRNAYLDTDLSKPATKVWAVINTTTYDLNSDITLKNIFGYINASGYTDDASDADGTNVAPVAIDLLVPPRPRRNEQYTDEFQVQGRSFDNRLTWVVGGLLDKTREPSGPTSINYATLVDNFGAVNETFEQNTIDSYGVFASGTFKVTDNLNLTAGYRHSWDHVRFAQAQQAGSNPTLGDSPVIIAPLTHYSTEQQGNTYNVDLEYHPSIDTMVYGGYRRGYKRGGFNESQTDPALAMFGPETVDDFYVGVKNEFKLAGMPTRFNIEGYYDLYHNMQVSYLSSNGVQLTTVTTNVPDTTFRGFDADVTIDPVNWLRVNASYSLIDAFNTKWPDTSLAGATGDLKNNPVTYTSRNKVSATARFHYELANDMGELAFAPTVSYQDKFYTSPVAFTLPAGEALALGGQVNMASLGGAVVPGYTLVDLRAEWNHFLGSKVDAAVNVTNLTNKLFFLGNSATLNYGVQGDAYGPPRMINVELRTQF